MTDEPLVSVIIPSYNHAEFIGAAVTSALDQTYTNLEVIVIDNHSTDRTLEVLAALAGPRLKVFQFNNGGRIAAGRNFGVDRSRGEYLAFLDSDDVWRRDKLEIQLPHLRDRSIVLVGSDCFPLGEVVYYRQHLSFHGKCFREFGHSEALLANPVMTSSAVLRRCDFIDENGFDEGDECRYIEDWELWLRFALRGHLRILADKLIGYRIVSKKQRDVRDVALRSLDLLKRENHRGHARGRPYLAALGNCYVRMGKAHLDCGDRIGIRYYLTGLLFSGDWSHRLRSLGGVCLFLVPSVLRTRFIQLFYRVNFRVQRVVSGESGR